MACLYCATMANNLLPFNSDASANTIPESFVRAGLASQNKVRGSCVPSPLSRGRRCYWEEEAALWVFFPPPAVCASRFVPLSVLGRLCDPYKVLLVTRGEMFDLIKLLSYVCFSIKCVAFTKYLKVCVHPKLFADEIGEGRGDWSSIHLRVLSNWLLRPRLRYHL